MCPACLMSVTWAVVAKISAGGLTALVVRNLWERGIEKVPHDAATRGRSVGTVKEHGSEPIRALAPTAPIPRRRSEP